MSRAWCIAVLVVACSSSSSPNEAKGGAGGAAGSSSGGASIDGSAGTGVGGTTSTGGDGGTGGSETGGTGGSGAGGTGASGGTGGTGLGGTGGGDDAGVDAYAPEAASDASDAGFDADTGAVDADAASCPEPCAEDVNFPWLTKSSPPNGTGVAQALAVCPSGSVFDSNLVGPGTLYCWGCSLATPTKTAQGVYHCSVQNAPVGSCEIHFRCIAQNWCTALATPC